MKYLLRIIFCFSASISACLRAAPVEHFSCENLASNTETDLCHWFKSSLEDEIEIELLPDKKISDWQLQLSDTPKLLVKYGTGQQGRFSVIRDIAPGEFLLDIDNDELVPKDDKSRLTIQKRNLSDKTMMVLLLPREEMGSAGSGGSGDITDDPGSSEGISPWIIIAPSLGFILHIGGWFATIADIYESYFYGTAEDRSDTCSITRVISYILTGFLAHIPYLIVRRWKKT